MKTPPFLGTELGASANFGSDRLDCLVADTVSNLQRLSDLDASSATAADLVSELRDNLYPSLLTVAEELRELDDDVGELNAPEPSLAPEDMLVLAQAFRSAQELAASVRQVLPSIEQGYLREELREHARSVETAISVAAAIVHRLVVSESTDDEAATKLEDSLDGQPEAETL